MKNLFTLIFIFTCFNSFTQKKILDHSDFDIWNRIQSPQIAADGNNLLYSIQTGEKDSKLIIKDKQGNLILTMIDRRMVYLHMTQNLLFLK